MVESGWAGPRPGHTLDKMALRQYEQVEFSGNARGCQVIYDKRTGRNGTAADHLPLADRQGDVRCGTALIGGSYWTGEGEAGVSIGQDLQVLDLNSDDPDRAVHGQSACIPKHARSRLRRNDAGERTDVGRRVKQLQRAP